MATALPEPGRAVGDDDRTAASESRQIEDAVTGLVEDAGQARQLFVRLRRQRNLVTLRPATASREYGSILLSLDTAQQYLVLDAPRPRPAPGLLRPGVRVYARSHVDGAPLIFISTIDALLDGEDGDEPNLLLHWPSRISYFQRRQEYRVNVPATLMPSPARLIVNGKPLEARLIDLSAAGAAILLASKAEGVAEGDILPCILPLPEADLQLRFVVRQLQRSRDGMRIGGSLALDSERDRQYILRAVMTIERWWLQQH